jgi:hypothetical protein
VKTFKEEVVPGAYITTYFRNLHRP